MSIQTVQLHFLKIFKKLTVSSVIYCFALLWNLSCMLQYFAHKMVGKSRMELEFSDKIKDRDLYWCIKEINILRLLNQEKFCFNDFRAPDRLQTMLCNQLCWLFWSTVRTFRTVNLFKISLCRLGTYLICNTTFCYSFHNFYSLNSFLKHCGNISKTWHIRSKMSVQYGCQNHRPSSKAFLN